MHVSAHSRRSITSNRQSRHLPQSFCFAFTVYSHQKHSKYLEKEFNHGLPQYIFFFMDIASVKFVLAKAISQKINPSYRTSTTVLSWKLRRCYPDPSIRPRL